MAKFNISLANALSKFSGEKDENLDFFLKNLEQISELEKWDANKKALILKLNLSGRALKEISETNFKEDNDYDEIVKLLKKKFTKKLNFSEIQAKFNELSQKPNQCISDLIDKVNHVTNEYLEITNESNDETKQIALKMKSQKLLDAMRSDIRVEVMKRGAHDFETIAKIAKDVEFAMNTNEFQINNVTRAPEIEILIKNQIESNKKIEDLTQKLDKLTQTKMVNNTVSNSNSTANVTCHICSKRHLTTECWYYPNNQLPNQNNNNQRYNPYNKNKRGRNANFGRNRRNQRNNRSHLNY